MVKLRIKTRLVKTFVILPLPQFFIKLRLIAGIQITILSTDDMDIFNLQLETICFSPLKPLKK
jgi:hypothetical protein